jgi:hypothetical protein
LLNATREPYALPPHISKFFFRVNHLTESISLGLLAPFSQLNYSRSFQSCIFNVLILPSPPMRDLPPGAVNRGKGAVFLRNYDDWATCRPRSLGVGIRDIRECDVSPVPASSNKPIPFQGRKYLRSSEYGANLLWICERVLPVTGFQSWKGIGARSLQLLRQRIDGNGKRRDLSEVLVRVYKRVFALIGPDSGIP